MQIQDIGEGRLGGMDYFFSRRAYYCVPSTFFFPAGVNYMSYQCGGRIQSNVVVLKYATSSVVSLRQEFSLLIFASVIFPTAICITVRITFCVRRTFLFKMLHFKMLASIISKA